MSARRQKRDDELKVLDYYDVLLREQDVALLEGPDWLNDQVVAFFFEYLEREGLQAPPTVGPAIGTGAQQPPPAPAAAPVPPGLAPPQACGVLLLPPATSFLLMHSDPATAREILAPLKPASRGLVLFAVNDNPDLQRAAGGSHWSLLVYHRPSNTLRHYDSSPAAATSAYAGNGAAARQLAAAVGPALVAGTPASTSAPAALSSCSTTPGSNKDNTTGTGLPRFVEVSCMPRQTNGYDCGVYVLAVARAVCGWWLGRKQQQQGQGAAGDVATAGAAKDEDAATATTKTAPSRPCGDPDSAVASKKARMDGSETAGEEVEEESGAEGRWRQRERGMAVWLTPSYVADLRREVGELIRGKAERAGMGSAGARGDA